MSTPTPAPPSRFHLHVIKKQRNLIRYCRTNFAEAFVAWIHLKAIRVFVESVLRYEREFECGDL
jgi:hypothetical protein